MASAHKVISIMGTITDEQPKEGQIKGVVMGDHVTITVIAINMNTTKLRVKARNALFPRVGIAQEIYTKIVNQLQ